MRTWRGNGGKYQTEITRERSGRNAAAGAPFPPSLSALSCVSGPGLFNLHFQLLQLNGAAALLSVVENETQ